MAEPFLSEIRIMSFGFAPKGWALCNGQLLPINQNQALFSLLGTTYGGDGRVNFGLPNFQGRTPAGSCGRRIHSGAGGRRGNAVGDERRSGGLGQPRDRRYAAERQQTQLGMQRAAHEPVSGRHGGATEGVGEIG